MYNTINKENLKNLAYGTCFLASGGGGPLKGGLNLADALPDDAEIEVVSKEEALKNKDAYTAVVAYIGAPNQMRKMTDVKAAVDALKGYLNSLPGKIEYLVPVELGAVSTVVTCCVAHEKNKDLVHNNDVKIKVIDGDGAGRAVPKLNMLTYASKVKMDKQIDGVKLPGAILSNAENQKAELFVNTPDIVEEIARPFISSGIEGFNQSAGLAVWLMDNTELEKALTITGTVSQAIDVGKAINSNSDVLKNLTDQLTKSKIEYKELFTGTMATPEETTSGGFDLVKVIINGKSDNSMHIYALNENLIAWNSDEYSPVTMAPDSICYITTEGKVFSNADIDDTVIGKEVTVFAIKSHIELRKDEEIMKNFKEVLTNIGYPSNYKPITIEKPEKELQFSNN